MKSKATISRCNTAEAIGCRERRSEFGINTHLKTEGDPYGPCPIILVTPGALSLRLFPGETWNPPSDLKNPVILMMDSRK